MGGTIEEIEGLEELSEFGSATFTAKVIDILPETATMVNSTLVTYTPVITNFSASIPGLGSGDLGQETVLVFSNATDYYVHMMYYAFEGIGFTFLFAAYNLNWTKAVADINHIYGNHLIYQVFTVTEVVNGFKLAIPAAVLNASQKTMELEIKYTDNGVLSYGGFKYDGVSAISLSLGGDDEIPGYMLPIVMSTIGVVGIGLIYVIKRKNRI